MLLSLNTGLHLLLAYNIFHHENVMWKHPSLQFTDCMYQ